MDEKSKQEAEAIIERAQAKKGLITVLVHHSECSDDLHARMAAAELRTDRDWQAFTGWYDQRGERRIARKRWIARWKLLRNWGIKRMSGC